MLIAHIHPGKLNGRIVLPPSKSQAHRAVLCAALSKGISIISPIILSDDIRATIDAVSALGAVCTLSGDTLTVDGSDLFTKSPVEIDCGESGSTLRFLIPIAAAGGVRTRLTGKGRLPERPLGVYQDCLPPAGVRLDGTGLPLLVSGRLQSGRFVLPGDVSSQFITGLLFALPLIRGDSEIIMSSPLESAGYVDMTMDTLHTFGVIIHRTNDGFLIPGGQQYCACTYSVEADWSQAAFFMAAGALGSDLVLAGLRYPSYQGDAAAYSIFKGFGAELSFMPDGGLHCKPGTLQGQVIDASQVPDLVPILAVTAALCKGQTEIVNAGRLRIKESDRLTAIASVINSLGGRCEESPNGLIITGMEALNGGTALGANDHRIVMAASIAALRAVSPVTVTDAGAINKSYPAFFIDFQSAGGAADVIDMG